MGSHKGQVSFPGGRVDTADTSLAGAALRELHEEVGIEPHSCRVIGWLPVQRSLAGSPVYVIVARLENPSAPLVPCPDEVDHAFWVPVSELVRDRAHAVRFNIFGRWRSSYVYHAKDEIIWGLTAKIIYSAKFN